MPNKKPQFRKIKKTKQKPQTTTVTKLTKEIGLLGRALRYGGGIAGGYLGGALGGPMGATAGQSHGSSLGAAISRWLGAGDYTLNANSIVKSGQIPGMHGDGQSTIIRHKEYITDVITSGVVGAFSSRVFPINPGLSLSFPWLAGIAQQYQEYSIKGMVYHYVSASGDAVASTITTLPTVMMATQYRSTAPDFEDKLTMLNAYFSSDAKASEDFCHPIECDPKENPFNVQYVRGGAVPTGEDIKSYDLGKFTIATIGAQAANVLVGELWCTYEIELKKPYPTAQLDLFNQVAHFELASASTANRFGSLSIVKVNTIGVTFPTTNSLAFPIGTIGKYLVSAWWLSATANTQLTATVTNCTASALFTSTNTNQFGVSAAYTAGGPYYNIILDISDPNKAASFQFTGGTLTGSGFCEVIVTQLPDTFV